MAYASFKTRIGDLTGFASTDDTALSDWINDGIRELINSFSNDYNLLAQCATTQSFTSQAVGSETSAGALNTGKILTVSMGSYPCRKIDPRQKFFAGDSSSFASSQMETASTSDPVYYIESGYINALPSGNATKYSEVQYPVADLTAGTSGIGTFPDEAEHLVVLYVSIKSLQQMMSNKTANLPSDISFPVIPVLSIPTLATVGSLTLPSLPVVPAVSVQSVTITGTAPTYVKPVSSQTAFNDYWTLSDFGDSDPEALSISAVHPAAPTISAASVTITGTAPTYAGPVATPNFSQVDTYIDTDEDVELAQAKLQEINAQMSEFSTKTQDALNKFNKENIEYQAKLQKDIQDAQLTDSNEAKKLQKYSAELQQYQADVSREVQEYTQKLSRYQLELNTVYTAWAKTESDNLAKYQADIQNELNDFNKENAEYQAKLQKDIQDAQLSDTNEARKLQKYSSEVQSYSAEVNSKIQEWVNEEWTQNFQKYQSDYSNKLQEYSNDIQSYQAEVSKSAQDFNTKLQKHSTDYQWLQSQYAQLKSDYNSGLQLLLGRPLTAGEQQRR